MVLYGERDAGILDWINEHRRPLYSQLYQYSLVSFSENGYVLHEVSFDLHHDKMPDITTEYEDKFSAKGNPIYFVRTKYKGE